MSDEDFEKKAEFILEQQAQFASQIGQLEDIVARLAQAQSIDSTSPIGELMRWMSELQL